ncbi:MAG: hypothetical protein ABIB93_02970 [Chloroflexota bacterium]
MVERLFSDDTNFSDELYRIIRDENRCAKVKSDMENLWGIYHPYADGDFPKQLAQDFHARYWEMYLTCTLVHNSFNVAPKQTRAKGPDIKIDHASTTIWVEAVIPTSGDPSKPDSVPNLQMGVAQQVPDDQIILRYRSVIYDKFNKYCQYLEDGIIKVEDCYIIALNGCKIQSVDREPPRIVRSVLPFGWEVVTFDTSSHEVLNSGYQYRSSIRKASGSQVDTDIFTKPEYQHISAVMFSNIDVANPTSVMGEDFIIVRNPLATGQLPDDFLKVGWEYKAELSQTEITLFSRNLRQV